MTDQGVRGAAAAAIGPKTIIRSEVESDVEAIFEVTRAAFEHHLHSDHSEPFIIDALRAGGALTVSLVAEVDGRVVGHVGFSPVVVSDGSEHWHALGPVSVAPGLQRRGIGTALIDGGLALLRSRGAKGCVLVGDPRYYGRFGFRTVPGLTAEGFPPHVFLALPFDEPAPHGTVTFHEGFSAKGEIPPR